VSSKLTTQPTTSFVPRFLSRWTKALGARSGTCQRTGERQRIVRSRAAEADTEVATPIEKSSTAFEPVMDIDAVMKILPHR